MKTTLTALRVLLVLSALTGTVYPAAITLVAQRLWPAECTGSIWYRNGRPMGSRYLGQECTAPNCFWPRPSATRPAPYTAFDQATGGASGGSNLGPTNPALAEALRARLAALHAAEEHVGVGQANGDRRSAVPTDLVTCSGSGLDPEITREAALYQAPRVARARGLPADAVVGLIRSNSKPPLMGLFGAWRVNVLELNMSLDDMERAAKRP